VTVTAETVFIPRLAPSAPPVRRTLTRGERCTRAGLLLGTAVLYLWNLGSVGWANIYYAGAVQAMAQDWTAFFFGSTDAGNIVTVDTPPAFLWAMALSARVFGLSPWSMLLPQALIGVCTVAMLYAAVRRVAGPGAGLAAGAALALAPVAVEVFRYNNPDALLVLLLVTAAYAVVRATQTATTGWLLIAGLLIGLALLTKPPDALVPLPAMALAYLVAAPTGFRRRVWQLLAAGVAIVPAVGWWFAAVELSPPGSRPYIGGSRTDSALELALGDNGLGRVFGPGGGTMISGGVPEQTGPGSGSAPGILRMVDAQNGVFAGWLLPTALTLLLVGLWLTRRGPRTNTTRASLLLWGGWTVLTALVFSLADGMYHPSSVVALTPGVAALVGIGGALLWVRRRSWAGRTALAMLAAGTATWAWVVLDRTPEFLPWLQWVVVAAATVAVIALLVRPGAHRIGSAILALTLALTTLAAPAAFGARAVAEAGQGRIPGVGQAPNTPGAPLVAMLRSTNRRWSAATVGAQDSAALALASGTTVMGIGGFSGRDPAPTLEEFQDHVAAREVRWFVDDGAEAQQSGPDRDSEIVSWVREKFESTTIVGRTVYDLDPPLP
jgi:4-amino-4-deoxy-L-arabinose transferase-like glycosyltransferase